MNKIKCLVYAPVDTYSGYGSRARDFVKALFQLKSEEWDIKIISCRWGLTPLGFINDNSEWNWMEAHILKTPLDFQPDYFFSITIPNEFQPIGKFNIGVTALVETTVVPPDLLEGMNRMNLNIVSSEHAKKIAQLTSFDKLQEGTKNKIGELKLEKPIEVLFEGVDINIYQNKNIEPFILDNIPEKFCFLAVGHLLSGVSEMEDRKMLGLTIKTFLETFKNKKNKPALVLKVSTGGYSYVDEENTLKIVHSFVNKMKGEDLPNIYIIHGELTENEMNGLYNNDKIKVIINVGNEGYGRPELEFSTATGKPVIASPYGGHLDFLDKDFTVFVGGQLINVHNSAANQFLLKESQWFKPDPIQLHVSFSNIYEKYDKYIDNGKRLGYKCRTSFSYEKMVEKLNHIIENNLPKMSVPVTIKLPQIKNLENK